MVQLAADSNSATSYCCGHSPTATPCVSARVIAGHPAEPADSVAAIGSVGLETASVASGAWVAVGAAGAHAEKARAKIVNNTTITCNLFGDIFSSGE
jgi:hypothetical protein